MAPMSSPPVTSSKTSVNYDVDDVNITDYDYAVCKHWIGALRKCVAKETTDGPGPVVMNCHIPSRNTWIPGEQWIDYVEKWGLSTNHELDRRKRKCPSDTRVMACEVALFSPYMQYIENSTKSCDLHELVGYIECQVRHILHVPKERNSRLWFFLNAANESEKSLAPPTAAMLNPCFDRRQRLVDAVSSSGQSCTLALELQETCGSWPTGNNTCPTGELAEYMTVFGRQVTTESWPEVKVIETSLLQAAIGQADELSSRARHKYQSVERDLKVKQDRLTKLISRHEAKRSSLLAERNELERRNQATAMRENALESSIRELTENEMNFNEQVYHMHQLNRVHSDVVSLDVGGRMFYVPTEDLVKHKSSLFGTVFSGRYNVQYTSDETFFLDTDPTLFTYIHVYLCSGLPDPSLLPKTSEELTQVIRDADYYKLHDFVTYLEDVRDGLPSMHDEEESPSSDVSTEKPGKKCGVM